ncbi:MAG: TlpA family protein disulfide reductase [Lawsonibacter sp.]|nr:TlpA family protein disulfide reductase [Lawsonibacter sp.]
MNKRIRAFVGIFLLSALLLSGCSKNSTDEPAESDSSSGVSGGASSELSAEPVTFTGTDLEGNTVSSDLFSQSALTMVNVWATYCNPCLREMPALGELAEDYAPETFQIIGIVSDVLEGDDQSLVEKLVQQTGAAYPHLLLNESLYYGLLLDVTAVPTTFFIDGNGAIVDTVIGAMEKSAWEEKINGLLEEG